MSHTAPQPSDEVSQPPPVCRCIVVEEDFIEGPTVLLRMAACRVPGHQQYQPGVRFSPSAGSPPIP